MKAAINRNVEKQILHAGGHPRIVRGGWSPPAEALPLLDEESTRYPSKKKRRDRKPKERCKTNPNGHTHEWMKDTEPVEIHEYAGGYTSFWDYHYKVVGHKDVLYRLCAHCGKTQWKSRGKFGRWTNNRPRPFTRYRWNGRNVVG